MQDRDVVLLGECLDVTPEAVPDLLKEGRRGDLVPEVRSEEPRHLPTDRHVRDVGVEIQAVDAGKVQTHVAVQHVVDVCHARHGQRDSA